MASDEARKALETLKASGVKALDGMDLDMLEEFAVTMARIVIYEGKG